MGDVEERWLAIAKEIFDIEDGIGRRGRLVPPPAAGAIVASGKWHR